MRAVVHDRYGPPEVLELREVDRPTPGDREVLVRVHATTVNRTDCAYRSARPWFMRLFSGLVRPRRRVLGSEFAGVVEAAGPGVTGFAVSDEVFGVHQGFGAYAEYIVVGDGDPIAPLPAGTTFAEAAAVPDGFVLGGNCLRPIGLHDGQRIVVYGASGSIGTAAVQLAKHAGAHVTAVCNTPNVDVVRSLGPDEVVDHLRDDFTARGESWDVVVDAVGKLPYRRARRALTPTGRFVSTDGGYLWQNPFLALLSRFSPRRRVLFPIPRYTQDQVRLARELVEAGAYRAVVDRSYPLEDVVEATHYVETGQKLGNVVLDVVAPG